MVCACKVLTDLEKFRVTVYTFGAFEAMALPRDLEMVLKFFDFVDSK